MILEQLAGLGKALDEARCIEASARATVARAEESISERTNQLNAFLLQHGRDLIVWMSGERVALITRQTAKAGPRVLIYGPGGELEFDHGD